MDNNIRTTWGACRPLFSPLGGGGGFVGLGGATWRGWLKADFSHFYSTTFFSDINETSKYLYYLNKNTLRVLMLSSTHSNEKKSQTEKIQSERGNWQFNWQFKSNLKETGTGRHQMWEGISWETRSSPKDGEVEVELLFRAGQCRKTTRERKSRKWEYFIFYGKERCSFSCQDKEMKRWSPLRWWNVCS